MKIRNACIRILRKILREKILQLIVIVSLVSISGLQAQAPLLKTDFDDYVAKTLEEWNAYGVIIAVGNEGKMDFIKGYGTRKYGDELLPDKTTLFNIASVTKSFTATAIGILIDEGRCSWDDPVQKYIPEFMFADDYVSKNITIRDILCHRAGFPHTVGSMIDPDYLFSDLINDLKETKPVVGFREKHSYSNVGYAIAGEIISRISGLSYNEFISRRIFDPLDMESSYTGTTYLKSKKGDPNDIKNIFLPVHVKQGEVISNLWDLYFNELYDPAGGVITNSVDILHWLIMQLQEGVYNGRQLLSKAVIQEMHSSQIVVHPLVIGTQVFDMAKLNNPYLNFVDYGLGWFIYDYQGLRVIEHTGLGANRSSIAFIPEKNLCISVCTNSNTDSRDEFRDMRMTSALKLYIIDRYMSLPENDWSTIFYGIHENEAARSRNE